FETPMISVAAIRMQQFGVQFYQASLSASDIDKLVRFEVLSYGEQSQPVRGGRKKVPAPTKVNWDLLERRIAANEKAYQRQIIRKKIDGLVGRDAESAGAGRHPARNRRPASAAGAARGHRALRRRAVHRAGSDLRS